MTFKLHLILGIALALCLQANADMSGATDQTLRPFNALTAASSSSNGSAAPAVIQPATTSTPAPTTAQPTLPAVPGTATQANTPNAISALAPLMSALGAAGNTSTARSPASLEGHATPNFVSSPSAPFAPTSSSSFDSPLSAGSPGVCGGSAKGTDMWSSTLSVAQEKVIPPGGGYDMNATGWPKLRKEGGRISVDFSPDTKSMCTSATASAFMKHIADLVNSGELTLTQQEIQFLNGPQVHHALNGNTYSVAALYDFLGGQSVVGTHDAIEAALKQARPGDVLKFDRKSGSGHSTIFKEVKGDQVCYWSSNTKTNGVGQQCESIRNLTDVVISRFPSDLSGLPAKIDAMMNNANVRTAFASDESASKKLIHWADNLTCPGDSAGAGNREVASSQKPPLSTK